MDGQLVSRVRGGDRAAFDVLVKRHYSVVFAVTLARLRTTEVAEDLTQEVFLRLYLQIGSLRDGDKFGSWAHTVARNLATEWLRQGQRRSRVLPLVPLDSPDHPDPSTGVIESMQREDENRLLWRLLDRLPPEQREIVLLHFMEGLSKREVAERLGMHPSTVGRVIDRALVSMRQSFEASLRETVRPPRNRSGKVAKVSATVLTVAGLPASARAELISSPAMAEKMAVVTAAAHALTPPGFLTQLTAKVAAGVTSMGLGKAVASVAVAVAVLTGAGVYVARESDNTPPWAEGNPGMTHVPKGWHFEVWDSPFTHMVIKGPGRNSIIAEGLTLEAAIWAGWKASPPRIQADLGLPDLRKDFTLVAPEDADPKEYRKVLQQSVEIAWNVSVRPEKQVRDVLVLRAPAGRPSAFVYSQAPQGAEGSTQKDGDVTLVRNNGIAALVRALETEEGKPVVDETRLWDSYNYQWKGRAAGAVTSQLGLELTPEKREIEVVVVEQEAEE